MAVDRFPVEEGTILLFARAIGDPNPVYTDPRHAASFGFRGVLAPPTYVQSSAQFDPDYALRPRLGEPWFGSGRHATGRVGRDGDGEGGAGGTGLHAEQHFEYHRPLVAGAVLHATTRPGEGWEKQGRSGKLVFSETITEYRDEADDLVVTARSVAVMTEKPVSRGER